MRAPSCIALLVAALLAALLPGCRRDSGRKAAEEQVAAALRDLDLVRVRSAGLAPPGPHSRVILRPEGIDADDIALIRSLSSGVGRDLYESLPPEEAAALPVMHRQLVALSGWAAPPAELAPGSLEIPPLRRSLEYMVSLDKKIIALDPMRGPDLRLNVYAVADAPYELVMRALYTAGQAGYGAWALAVRGPHGEGTITVGAAPSGMVPACIVPSLKLDPKGIAVTDRGRMIAGAPGACPSVPRKDGQHDLDALVSLLRQIAEASPGCGAAYVQAGLQAPWREVAPVLAAVAVEAHYKEVALAVPRVGVPEAEVDCSGAIEPAALVERPELGRAAGDAGAPPPDDAGIEEEWPWSLPQPKPLPSGGSVAIGGSGGSHGVPGATQVVAAMRPSFRRCYQRALAEHPDLAGSVRITAKIGPSGEVLSATPSASTLPERLVVCVTTRVQTAQFSPPPGGGAVIVIPVTFQPS